MLTLLAAIPYRTLPDFSLGPVTVRTFGLMVALGIVLGTVIGSRYVANRGVDPEQYTSLATRAVIGGLIGARGAWVLTHLEAITSPIDVIAVWEGGMQFSGGLLVGAVVGWWSARGRFSRTERWYLLDGTAIGLTAGMALGRIGCLAVGEHYGSTTTFALGMTYQGGGTIEPVEIGQTIHNTALYEFLHLAVLGAIFAVLVRRAGDRGKPWPLGAMGAIFLTWYGVWRFITDVVRVNDERLVGMTGAQWSSIVVVGLGLWLFTTMGSRRVGESGRAIVSTGVEPKSAVRVIDEVDEDGESASEDVETDEADDEADEDASDDPIASGDEADETDDEGAAHDADVPDEAGEPAIEVDEPDIDEADKIQDEAGGPAIDEADETPDEADDRA